MSQLVTSPISNHASATTLTVVRSLQELAEATTAWTDLLRRGAIGHNVHNDPRTIFATLEQNPALQSQIVLVYHGECLVCVAPFYIEPARFSFEFSVWRLLSLRARALRVFGENIVLAADVDPELCVNLVADFLRVMASSIDFLHVYGMNLLEPFWKAAARGGTIQRKTNWIRLAMRHEKIHKIQLNNSFDEYVASLSSGTRQTLRYSHRRFFASGRGRVEKYTNTSEVQRLLQSIEQVYGNSWQAKSFGQQSNSETAKQRLFERIASEGWFRSYILLQDDQPIAYQLGLHYGQTYYLLDCAFDQRFASASPGSVLTFAVMEDLHSSGDVEVWDFGFGDMPYKRSLGNLEYDAAIVYFVPRNRWRFIFRCQQLLNAVYDHGRSLLIRLKIDTIVRKLIKQQT